MILPFTVILSFFLITPSWCGLDSIEFESFIEPKCFRLNEKEVPYINGQENPLASTMENFISLVEKFEVFNPTKDLKDVLFYFIRNYTYTNVEYNSIGDIIRWTPKDADYSELDKMWEPNDNLRTSFLQVEDPFTDAEKCSLYFMISHSIVRKPRKVSLQKAVPVMQNNTNPYRRAGELDHNDDDLYPLEQGVVAIQGTEEAVSLGSVLTGLYVGLNERRKREINTFAKVKPEIIPVQGTIVDPLYTLTIAEAIAMSYWRPEAGFRQNLAQNGMWKSIPVGSDIETKDICPMIYRLLDGTEEAYSYSSVRGAADGLILGKVSASIKARKPNVKLSQILRQYYTRGGIVAKTPDLGDVRASFCNREYFLNTWDEMIKEQVRLFVLIASTGYKYIEESTSFAWNKYSDARKSGLFQHKNKIIQDYCAVSMSLDRPEDLPIETPLDVIAVLKTGSAGNGIENFKRQQLIIGSLAKRLQLSYYGSKMTIFTDQKSTVPMRSAPGVITLRSIVNDSYSSACAACLVTQTEAYSTSRLPDDEVILAINQYLTARKENETRWSGVNGKVLVLFNFDEDVQTARPSTQQYKLESALRELHLNHRDLNIFTLGKNIDVLKQYSRGDTNFVLNAFDASEEEIGKQLFEKLRATPAKLQYFDCSDAQNEKTAVYEDFITPNGVQHWAMPAEYFYKSFHPKFMFDSYYGKVKLCHSRDTKYNERLKDTCQELNPGKTEILQFHNPCKGFTQYSCSPLFFSFVGINATEGSNQEYCDAKNTENECRTLDQIKIRISHEGVRCSGSVGLLATPIFLIIGFIASHIFSKYF